MGDPSSVRDFRRAQIITAARTLVYEQGLEGLTIGALEARLDFSRGVITYHFDNKDEIVEAVLSSALDEIEAATRAGMKASLTLAEKVHAMLSQTVTGFVENKEAGHILLTFWGRIPRDTRVTKLNANLYATYRAYARKLIDQGVSEGAFETGDPDAMAALFVAVVIGIATQVYFAPGAIDPEAAVDEAAASVLARLTAI